jgi:hypothetical protein
MPPRDNDAPKRAAKNENWAVEEVYSQKMSNDAGDAMPVKTQPSPTLDALRQKFLVRSQSDAVESVTIGKLAADVDVVSVKPREGGPSKTADRKGGKITIVQG